MIRPDFESRKYKRLMRKCERLANERGIIPLRIAKQTCGMVLRFTSLDLGKFEDAFSFERFLEAALTDFCKSNNLDLSIFFVTDK